MVSGYVTGTTTDEVVDAVVSEMVNKKYFHALLKNVGEMNTISYQVVGSVVPSGELEQIEVTLADVAPEATVEIEIGPVKYCELAVQVKSKAAGSSSEYRIEYMDGV